MSDIVARISNNIIEAEIVENIFDIHIEGAVVTTASSSTVSKVAGQTLSGHRAVCVKSDGKVYYADADTPSCKSVLGITTHSAAINETVAVQTTGQLSMLAVGHLLRVHWCSLAKMDKLSALR